MPALGADMRAGRLIEWHVAVGDRVARGDIVATVDTDKAEIDIETFHGGVIERLLVEPGTKVDVGGALAQIGDGSEEAPAATANGQPALTPAAVELPHGRPSATAKVPQGLPSAEHEVPQGLPSAEHEVPHVPASAATELPHAPPSAAPAIAPGPAAAHRRRVSPLARRIAAARGIDLDLVHGTGPGGAVTQADVERAADVDEAAAPHPSAVPAAASAPAAPADESPVPAAAAAHRSAEDRRASLQRAVGELMARSKREIPHYYLQRDIDMTAALDWLAAHNANLPAPQRVLPAALLLRACVLAAHDVPEVNGVWEDGAFRAAAHVDLGVAVSLRGGNIIAPVIPAAEALELDELMAALRALIARTRRGVLRGADIAGATITVTSLGEHGADLVHGVIFAPQVALVGFGRIASRPWACGDMLASRRVVTATLAGDHRVSDGHRGSLYLSSLDHHLQEPDQL